MSKKTTATGCGCGNGKQAKPAKKPSGAAKSAKAATPGFKQVSEAEWVKMNYGAYAMLDATWEQLEKRFNIKFEEYEEDGLGTARGAFLRTNGGVQFVFRHLLQAPTPGPHMTIEGKLHPNDGCKARDLRDILAATGIDAKELTWIQDGIKGINK